MNLAENERSAEINIVAEIEQDEEGRVGIANAGITVSANLPMDAIIHLLLGYVEGAIIDSIKSEMTDASPYIQAEIMEAMTASSARLRLMDMVLHLPMGGMGELVVTDATPDTIPDES